MLYRIYYIITEYQEVYLMELYDKNVLLIEDDKHIYSLIKATVKPYNINLNLKSNGKNGLKSALSNKYDLILLDIMLPEKDGWQICREIRNSDCNSPIIIITAKVEETDKVLGLEMGADDYITKPFSPRELIARMKAVLRRYDTTQNMNNKSKEKNILKFEHPELKIELNNYRVKYKDKYISFTPKEFELLSFLARNKEQVFKREQLLNKIWGFDNYAQTRTIDEHIKRLRKKLKKAGLKQKILRTVWGVGYKFTLNENTNGDENNET